MSVAIRCRCTSWWNICAKTLVPLYFPIRLFRFICHIFLLATVFRFCSLLLSVFSATLFSVMLSWLGFAHQDDLSFSWFLLSSLFFCLFFLFCFLLPSLSFVFWFRLWFIFLRAKFYFFRACFLCPWRERVSRSNSWFRMTCSILLTHCSLMSSPATH